MKGDTPELKTDTDWVPGLAAVLLFVVFAVVFVRASFPAPEGFPEGANVTASIGYAMFNITAVEGTIGAEGFLVAFITIAVVLDAALDGAVMLARREDDGQVATAMADGGERPEDDDRRTDGSDDGEGPDHEAGPTDAEGGEA